MADFIDQLRSEFVTSENNFGAPNMSVNDLIDMADEATRLSQTDFLTGVPNRMKFVSELSRSISSFQRHGIPFSLVNLDLKKFKQLNENYGHLVGDEALKLVGSFLKEHSRPTDIPCRIGGDEFAIILNETTFDGAKNFEGLLLKSVENGMTKFKAKGSELKVDFRISVSEWDQSMDVADFLERLDRKMYEEERK